MLLELRKSYMSKFYRRQRAPEYAARSLFQALLVGNRKFPAALFTAAREEFAAILRSHALTKAMFVLAGAAGWLECAFHR